MSCGLIIEGIPLTGKTTLLNAIENCNLFSRLKQATKLIYHENLTQRILENYYNRGFLDKQSNLNLLKNITDHLWEQDLLLKLRGFASCELLFILERFHLTHVVYYPDISWSDVISIDERLLKMDTKLLILTIEQNTFLSRLKERENTPFMKYIKRYGKDKSSILNHYMDSQKEYLKFASQSGLETKILATDQYSEKEILEKVLAFYLKDI